MSQPMKYPVDVSLSDVLKCRLPNDDETQKTEIKLLKKLDLSENFMKLLDETKNRKQQELNDYTISDFTEDTLNLSVTSNTSEAKVTIDVRKEDSCVFKSSAENQILIPNAENQIPIPNADNQIPILNAKNQIPILNAENQISILNAKKQIPILNAEKHITVLNAENQIPILNDSARELYNKATVCFLSGQFQDSLVNINQAMAFCELQDDKIRLITFKTTVLNAMADFVGTLRYTQDVSSGLRSGYLIFEGAKALEKLNLLLTAEEWLKKALEIRGEERDPSSWAFQQLLQDVRLRRIYEPLIQNAPIKISLSKTGRVMYAKRTIANGEILFSELPEFLEKSLASQNVPVCSQCGTMLLKPDDVVVKEKRLPSDVKKAIKKCWPTRTAIPCEGCNKVAYCSESCRQEASLSYHKDICPSSPNSPSTVLYDVRDSFRDVTADNGYSWQGWWNAEFSPLLLARMWATVLTQTKLRAGNQTSLNHEDLLEPIFAKIKKYSVNSDTRVCTRIPRMFDSIRNLFKRSKFLGYEITENEFDQTYHRISTNYISFYDVYNPIHECLDRTKNNQKLYKKIVRFLEEPVQKVELHGLFPLASCINHCCLPNAEILSRTVDGKPGIATTAKRDISEMEEITIAYVNPQLPRSERQELLFRRFAFRCQCLKCEFEGDGPDTCTQCGKHPQPYTCNRPSQNGEDSVGCLHNYSAVQDTSVMQNFTGNLQFSQFKTGKLFDTNCNCRREKLRDPPENNHLEEFNTQAEKEVDHEFCVTDKGSLDIQENLNFDNRSNHIPFRQDLPEGSEHVPNGQAEEIRTRLEKTKSLRSVTVIDDTVNLKPPSSLENEGLTKYPHCGRCGRAWYCSQKCQREAWKKGHKQICNKL